MATALKDHQFEILPHENAASGLLFGLGGDVELTEEGFAPGGADWITQDVDNERRGATGFGRDVLRGPTWAWSLFANKQTVADARSAVEAFATAWRPRLDYGELTAIRYLFDGGQTRRVYGRPRRFDAPPSNMILSGFVPIDVDFKAVDAYVYSDELYTARVNLSTTSAGGFTFPLTFPVTTQPPGTSSSQYITVGGTARTYPIVRFHGPWLNPVLSHDDWNLSLNLEIPDGQYVEVDLRPWRLTALLNGNSNVAGLIGRRTWLEDIYFEPGPHNLAVGGFSASGGAHCEVEWRSAWNAY